MREHPLQSYRGNNGERSSDLRGDEKGASDQSGHADQHPTHRLSQADHPAAGTGAVSPSARKISPG
jgi:hypothetical protein